MVQELISEQGQGNSCWNLQTPEGHQGRWFCLGSTADPARLWGSCSEPVPTVLSPAWMHCRVFTSENIPLPSEQNGFLNSPKKVTSSVTQLSALVRLLSPVVTPSDSTDLRTGRT